MVKNVVHKRKTKVYVMCCSKKCNLKVKVNFGTQMRNKFRLVTSCLKTCYWESKKIIKFWKTWLRCNVWFQNLKTRENKKQQEAPGLKISAVIEKKKNLNTNKIFEISAKNFPWVPNFIQIGLILKKRSKKGPKRACPVKIFQIWQNFWNQRQKLPLGTKSA